MAEYIDKDKLIEEIDEWLDSVGSIVLGKGLSSYGELLGCIEDAQVTDVQEVKCGRWTKVNKRPKSYIIRCSACGKSAYWIGKSINYKFCPNCGAKMVGGE